MNHRQLLITVLTSLAALHTHADVLELKDGKTLNGKYFSLQQPVTITVAK